MTHGTLNAVDFQGWPAVAGDAVIVPTASVIAGTRIGGQG